MKRLTSFIILFLFVSYSCTAVVAKKKIYLWAEGSWTKYKHGLRVNLNGNFISKVVSGELLYLGVKGDKKYKIELLDGEVVVAKIQIDSLIEDEYYVKGDLDGNTNTMHLETLEEKNRFVNKRIFFHIAYRYEEGLDDVALENNPSYGSAFLISSDGHIITNYHVIDKAKKITVKGVEGNLRNEYEAEIIAKDKNNDLVLLRLKDTTVKFSVPPYTLKTMGVNTGDEVSLLGYPLGPKLGDEVKLTTGVISAKSGFEGNLSEFQVSAAAQPGNSGGPLFDVHGNIIGVVYAKIRNAENITYAVKASYIQTLLSMLPEEVPLSTTNTITDKTLSERVAACSKFVYIIKSE